VNASEDANVQTEDPVKYKEVRAEQLQNASGLISVQAGKLAVVRAEQLLNALNLII